jgi:uncharacterized protein with FMN-binding domain
MVIECLRCLLKHNEGANKVKTKISMIILLTIITIGVIVYYFPKSSNKKESAYIVAASQYIYTDRVPKTTPQPIYKDGVYEGTSQSIYTSETYFGVVKVTVKNHQISKIDYKIIDQKTKEIFDQNYGKRYIGWNSWYVIQCKNDWQGVQTYPQKLLSAQNIDQIDAIAGATWSYNLFKDSVKIALEKAK